MLPKLYKTTHPDSPWLVVYTDTTQRNRHGKPKRVQKWFKEEDEAKEHQRTLLKTAASVGTSGLSMDARARADFYAGRQILDVAGHTGTSLTEALRDFVKTKPQAARLSLPLADLVPLFVTAKELEEHAATPTIENLKKRVTAWVRRENIITLADITDETLLALKQRKRVSARTKINDMAAVSSFLSWLKERRLRAENELLEMSRPQTDIRIPKVLTPEQVKALLEAAREVSGGRILRYITLLLLAGLRPGEAAHVTEEQVRLNAQPPFVRVVRGKKRDKPRPAPVLKNFRAWWTALPWPVDADGKKCALFDAKSRPDLDVFDKVRERAGLISRVRSMKTKKPVQVKAECHWQEDIPRHTWISVRMQQTKDEARVAYEAGTSIDMIHGHYLDTLDDRQVKAIEACRPPREPKRKRLTAKPAAARLAA